MDRWFVRCCGGGGDGGDDDGDGDVDETNGECNNGNHGRLTYGGDTG